MSNVSRNILMIPGPSQALACSSLPAPPSSSARHQTALTHFRFLTFLKPLEAEALFTLWTALYSISKLSPSLLKA